MDKVASSYQLAMIADYGARLEAMHLDLLDLVGESGEPAIFLDNIEIWDEEVGPLGQFRWDRRTESMEFYTF